RDAILLINAIQADPRNVLSEQDPRTYQQVIEMLIDDAPQQMFAKVGDFRILIDDEHAAGLEQAAADRFPIVGKNTPQIEHIETQARLPSELVGGLHAQRQRA